MISDTVVVLRPPRGARIRWWSRFYHGHEIHGSGSGVTLSRRGMHALEDWFPALLLGGVAIWVYVGALRNPFVYDDLITVVKNPSIVDLSDILGVLRYDTFRPSST